MKIVPILILLFLSTHSNSQNADVVEWINTYAINIEDANPNTPLSTFKSDVPNKFAQAKIFGFGETTHHGKEFFNLKAKFFKFLVETQHVKTFIMEDSYPAEAGISEWISGGEGNAETIANNFSIGPWYCKEIVDLLKWMRNYNQGKSKADQIQFFGMDIQNVKHIHTEIRNLVQNYNIPVDEELLSIVDACAERKVNYGKSTDWADVQLPKLKQLETILVNFQTESKHQENHQFNSALRALEYLKKYTYFVQHHYSQDRDLKMFENVKWIVENKSKNGKAFIWAHNEHINTQGFGHYTKRSIYNLGKLLKEQYKDDYYSVGFDFGSGILKGFIVDKNQQAKWKTFHVDKPSPKTYAETLIKANKDFYFIDFSEVSNTNVVRFFNKKTNQMVLGSSGYNPKINNLYKKRFSEMYDGLIFIKSISVPNYDLSEE